jgi:hypothetical protein
VHATPAAELGLGIQRNNSCKLDFLAVEILARDLWQPIELSLGGFVQTLVAVTEVYRRVPHLQVEELAPLGVVEE